MKALITGPMDKSNGETSTPYGGGCFVFDIVNNCAYYKNENVSADIELPELADVATSGSYNDLEDKPNLDASDNNTDISGLATVATTGSFDDLDNQYYVFNPSEFVHLYNDVNDTWSILTGNNFSLLQNCGLINGWIKNIDYLYKNTEAILENSLLNEINKLKEYFYLGKICYLNTNNQDLLITSLNVNYPNNNSSYDPINISISCTPFITNDFNTNFSNTIINNDEDIEFINNNIVTTVWTNIIVIDLLQNILYSQFRRILPAYQDNGIIVNSRNNISLNISSKSGNTLQLINTSGEEGLYAP